MKYEHADKEWEDWHDDKWQDGDKWVDKSWVEPQIPLPGIRGSILYLGFCIFDACHELLVSHALAMCMMTDLRHYTCIL